MACVVDLLKDCFSDCTRGLVETKSDKIDRLEKEAGKARAKGQTTKAEGLEAKVRGLKGEPPAAAPSAAQGAFAAVDGSEKAVTAQPGGDVVSKISFFDGMDPHFVSFVISQMKPQAFSPNQWICLEGEVGMEMFFLLDGTVQCVIGHNSDREKTIKEFSSGMHFGE